MANLTKAELEKQLEETTERLQMAMDLIEEQKQQMETNSIKPTKRASELYAYMDLGEVSADLLGKSVDFLGDMMAPVQTGAKILALHADIKLQSLEATKSIKIKTATKQSEFKAKNELEKAARKAFRQNEGILEGESSDKYEQFKKEMGL